MSEKQKFKEQKIVEYYEERRERMSRKVEGSEEKLSLQKVQQSIKDARDLKETKPIIPSISF